MRKVTKRQASTAVLSRLVELKLTIEHLKSVYGEYDKLLEMLIHAGAMSHSVQYKGTQWQVLLVDLFENKNTAWKSVAQRRFDLEISRHTAAPEDSIFKTRKGKKR